jgi:predicted membrane metal-binding protein
VPLGPVVVLLVLVVPVVGVVVVVPPLCWPLLGVVVVPGVVVVGVPPLSCWRPVPYELGEPGTAGGCGTGAGGSVTGRGCWRLLGSSPPVGVRAGT